MLGDDEMLDDLGDEPDLGDLGDEPDLGDLGDLGDEPDGDAPDLAAATTPTTIPATTPTTPGRRRRRRPRSAARPRRRRRQRGAAARPGPARRHRRRRRRSARLARRRRRRPAADRGARAAVRPGADADAAPDADDDLGDLDGDLGGDLGEEGELEDLELDDDALIEDDDEFGDLPAGSDEDTDGGFAVDGAADGPDSAEALGATRFSQGEDAMREGDYDQAVVLFEDAYANGFDIAELHAHLAFARYKASDNDPEAAQASLDLLDYAETIDPGLPILHAYRGAVLVSIGREEEAAEFFDRALYLDPNNELALTYRRDE
jgi:tetratricopeptide (TPR) repeat protein